MSSLSPELIEEKTKIIEEYMFEIEKQLRTGLEIIDDLKKEGKPETEEFQNQIIEIIKKIEFCASSVEKELEAEGSPTYYLANGRINIANEMPAFTITNADSEDDDDDDVDDDDDDDADSDVSFTEEERNLIENDDHYFYLKRYGLKPTAQFSFTIGEDLSGVTVECDAISSLEERLAEELSDEKTYVDKSSDEDIAVPEP